MLRTRLFKEKFCIKAHVYSKKKQFTSLLPKLYIFMNTVVVYETEIDNKLQSWCDYKKTAVNPSYNYNTFEKKFESSLKFNLTPCSKISENS